MKTKLSYGETLKLKLLDKFANEKVYGELVDISGYEAISELFKYQLKLFTQDKDIINKTLCNANITFALERLVNNESNAERLFNGIIETVSFTKRHNPKNSSNPEFEYSLTVVPQLANLQKVKHSRVFYKQKQQIVKVIEKLLNDYKIEHKFEVKNPELFIAETCIQYNESDYDFILRLIQSIGCYYFFKHEKGKHIMIISNQTSQYFNLPNKAVKHIDDDGQILYLHDISLHYSNYSTDFIVNAFSYANPDTTIEKSHSNTTHKKQEAPLLHSEEAAYICDVHDTNQVTKLVENSSGIQQISTEYMKGHSSYITFAVCNKFKLAGSFFKEFENKDCVITKLHFSANQYDGKYINDFTAIPSTHTFISQSMLTKPIISGLHFALVVNSEGKKTDQEPYSDDKGNILIKLLWGENNSICKANVLSASNSYSLPRVGSLVYVLFPNNNLYNDIPVVVGMHNQGLMNFNDKEEHYKNIYMSYPASSDKDLYNFIFFKDKKEKQEISINAKKDLIVNVEHNEIATIKNDKKCTIKNIRKVMIEEGSDMLDVNKGDIIIEVKQGQYNLICNGKVLLQSNDAIDIAAKKDLNINAGGKITIDGKDGINIKTNGDYQSDIKGSMSVIGKKLVMEAKTTANYESGTDATIKSKTQINLEGTIVEAKGKANFKILSPMTKISM